MATPVRHTPPAPPAPETGPGTVLWPLGWILLIAGGLVAILASWMIYPIDNPGMWAGYRDGVVGTVAIIAAMALRTTLPAAPALAVTGLCGVLLVLFAVFVDDGHTVFVTELVSGIVVLVGTALTASGRSR